MAGLGDDIKKRRKEAGITQQELARRVGIDQGYLSKIERGERVPGVSVMRSLVKEADAAVRGGQE